MLIYLGLIHPPPVDVAPSWPPDSFSSGSSSNGEVSSFWMRETLASLRADPLMHLSILWNKLRLSLGSYEVPDNHHIGWGYWVAQKP